MQLSSSYDLPQIVVLGNPVVDAFAQVDKAFLKGFNLMPGQVNTLNKQDFIELTKTVEIQKFQGGGLAANIAWCLGRLRHNVTFLGAVGNDPAGRFFAEDMAAAGVEAALPRIGVRTMEVFVLLTPDGARTLVETTLPSPMQVADIEEERIRQPRACILDGYILQSQPEVCLHAAQLCKAQGAEIILALAPAAISEQGAGNLEDLIKKDVIDLVIGNIKEYEALNAALGGAAQVALQQRKRVITNSGKGAAFYAPETAPVHAPCDEIETPADLTGAGESFAAGFIHGYLNGYPPQKSLETGHLLAREVIQSMGARPAGLTLRWLEK